MPFSKKWRGREFQNFKKFYLQQPQVQDLPQLPVQSHFLQEHVVILLSFFSSTYNSVYHIFRKKGIKTL